MGILIPIYAKNYIIRNLKRADFKIMNGLEMILKKIEDDNSIITKGILNKSIEKANQILEESENKALDEAKNILSLSEKQSQLIEENEKSGCEKYLQNEILKERNLFIEKTIEKTIFEIINSKNYFDILKALIIKYSHQKQGGELILSKKDYKSLPSDFLNEINRELKKNNSSVCLSKESFDFDGGFILRYDKIEENCTFEELISEKRVLIYDAFGKLIS